LANFIRNEDNFFNVIKTLFKFGLFKESTEYEGRITFLNILNYYITSNKRLLENEEKEIDFNLKNQNFYQKYIIMSKDFS